ncbi:MAG: hypothetical protein ACRC5M_07255 [Anaeroplasmataceae bacterium]
MENLNKSLVRILKNCENLLNTYKVVEGKNLETMLIAEFLGEYSAVKDRRKCYISLTNPLSSLAYVNDVSSFGSSSGIDYSEHFRVDILCKLISPFTRLESYDENTDNLIRVVNYLEMLEGYNNSFVKTLSYRYIRLFIILVINGFKSHACLVAVFLIDQAFIGEGVDKSIILKTSELNSSFNDLKNISAKSGITLSE